MIKWPWVKTPTEIVKDSIMTRYQKRSLFYDGVLSDLVVGYILSSENHYWVELKPNMPWSAFHEWGEKNLIKYPYTRSAEWGGSDYVEYCTSTTTMSKDLNNREASNWFLGFRSQGEKDKFINEDGLQDWSDYIVDPDPFKMGLNWS